MTAKNCRNFLPFLKINNIMQKTFPAKQDVPGHHHTHAVANVNILPQKNITIIEDNSSLIRKYLLKKRN